MFFKQHCLDFFPCNVVWSLSDNIAYGLTCVMLCQEYQEKIEQHFSCALLTGASRITLHRVLTCAMLYQEY